jgi:hypothetical protein
MTLRLAILTLLLATASARAGESPSFVNEVMPVISKAGCNLGTCHGNANGKGGLKLSLRGEDPARDHAVLVREIAGRRVNTLDPAASLILAKPSGGVAHQGGVRFSRESREYQTLHDWISAGAPGPNADERRLTSLAVTPQRTILFDDQQQIPLRVIAHFSDGSTRDVTNVACYETSTLTISVDAFGVISAKSWGEATVLVRFLNLQAPVSVIYARPQPGFRPQHPAEQNFIDKHIFAKLAEIRVNPSAVASDNVFVRRAYLDAIGILPTAEEAKSFVHDKRPDKRARLIDELLMRPEFAEHWALKWADLLRVEEKVLDERGVTEFHKWIKDGIAAGKPMDQFVREMIVARGGTFQNPPTNYYRANRDPLTRGETTARLFLGVRLQCARCHNHPFDRWTQDDYYAWSALFARIAYEEGENKRSDKLDKNEFKGEQTVLVKSEGEVKNARTNQNAVPRFLGANTPSFDAESDRLEPLSKWLTSADNRLFVESQVNLVWYHIMGRGLVEPIDDVRPTNPPTHPELMQALSRDFVASGFDLRHLVRTIMTSTTYALDAQPNETNADDTLNYSRAIVKRLAAEKLLDAQCQVLGVPAKFEGEEQGLRAGQMSGVNAPSRRGKLSEADRFLRTFGKPDRLLACECERSGETTLNQALVLVSGEGLQERLTNKDSRLAKWLESDRPASEVIDELYWTALQRPPTAEEIAIGLKLLDGEPAERLAGLQDLAWALLNAKEFVFRH